MEQHPPGHFRRPSSAARIGEPSFPRTTAPRATQPPDSARVEDARGACDSGRLLPLPLRAGPSTVRQGWREPRLEHGRQGPTPESAREGFAVRRTAFGAGGTDGFLVSAGRRKRTHARTTPRNARLGRGAPERPGAVAQSSLPRSTPGPSTFHQRRRIARLTRDDLHDSAWGGDGGAPFPWLGRWRNLIGGFRQSLPANGRQQPVVHGGSRPLHDWLLAAARAWPSAGECFLEKNATGRRGWTEHAVPPRYPSTSPRKPLTRSTALAVPPST